MSGLSEIIAFNEQQVKHVELVQRLVFEFCSQLMQTAIGHDSSKFSEKEYAVFVESRESLNATKTGTEEQYQAYLKTEAIQHHITKNPHHPEYWDAIGEEMPLAQIIVMFCDWESRSLQRGTNRDDFWAYNISKLKNQPKALAVVELLRNSFFVPRNIQIQSSAGIL